MLGGFGKDTLTGGAGLDTFRFETAPNALTNLDTITDFSLADDTIELENGIFKALIATGALNAESFKSGAGVITAADANDYLIYNTTTGALYYDANGSKTGAAIQIATLTTKPLLTADDFGSLEYCSLGEWEVIPNDQSQRGWSQSRENAAGGCSGPVGRYDWPSLRLAAGKAFNPRILPKPSI